MKALSRKTQEQKNRELVDKYIRDNYEETIYDAIAMNAATIVRQTVAEFLLALSYHGYGAKRLHDALEWFLEVNNMPGNILGKPVNADDVVRMMRLKYDLDLERIDPHYQSYAEFKEEMSRGKE